MFNLIGIIIVMTLFIEIYFKFVFTEPIPGDILEWKNEEYKVILWDGFDYYDVHLEAKDGRVVKVDLHEISDAKIKGLGIVRLHRYFKEVLGV